MIAAVGTVLAVFFLILVLWMLLTRRLREKYAVMWLVIGVAVLIVGLFPQTLYWLTSAFGVQLPANLLFAAAVVLLLGVSLHLSWELSQAEEEIRRLAEEASISRAELSALEQRVAHLELPASRDVGTGPTCPDEPHAR